MIAHITQRWYNYLRRLSRNGQVLGLTDMHSVTELRGTWCRCALLSGWTRERCLYPRDRLLIANRRELQCTRLESIKKYRSFL